MLFDRRQTIALLAGGIATPALGQSPEDRATDDQARGRPELRLQAPAMSRLTAYAFSFAGLAGGDIKLADHAGSPILVVNTASLCGYTPQYAGLQHLWTRYRDRGLMIVGVPSNDFGGQEPGGTDEITRTAHGEYGIGFPLTAKMQVKGQNPHPFYKWAAGERPLETPRWNFHKYLIGRDGRIAAVFATDVEPTDARVINAIVKELARPQ
jgi:glutathione peroxidase